MFFGDTADKLETIGLYPADSPEDLMRKIMDKVETIDEGDGVLIFVDMFAGSPYNMTAMAIDELKDTHKLQCLAGVNMPLLMEALPAASRMELDELVEELEKLAPATVINLRKTLEI